MIVRPAGSAVVELDQPTSRIQKGPAFIHPLYPGAISQGISEIGGSYGFIPSTIAPPVGSSTPASNLNDENVVVENSELLRARDQVRLQSILVTVLNPYGQSAVTKELLFSFRLSNPI